MNLSGPENSGDKTGLAALLAGGMAALLASTCCLGPLVLITPSMDCPVCPITLKKALMQVPGVSQACVNFEKRQAVVTFDDAKTNVRALTESTKNAGYPSTVMGVAN